MMIHGALLDVHGEAVYGTVNSRIPRPSWGRLTEKGRNLYLHVFDWPADGTLVLENVANPAVRAVLLGAEEKALDLAFDDAGRLTVSLPESKSAALIPVIRLEFQQSIMPAAARADSP